MHVAKSLVALLLAVTPAGGFVAGTAAPHFSSKTCAPGAHVLHLETPGMADGATRRSRARSPSPTMTALVSWATRRYGRRCGPWGEVAARSSRQ
eukprot:scaffold98908_cov33-Phaeocystis_antarctica.AAC.1